MMDMKIPIKYGLLITLGVMAWVLISHALVPNPNSVVHAAGAPIFFNILQFVMIYLGLRAKERAFGDRQDFKKGLKTGVTFSFVYGLTASIFFVVLLVVGGPRWLEGEPGAPTSPIGIVAAQAFVGLFLSALFLGLIYSALISFFLAKRQSEEV